MNRIKQLATGACTLVLMGLTAAPLYAQLPAHLRDYPLAQRKAAGDIVGPMFNGWIGNEDGSVTLVFGFVNRNREEIVDIPLGENNYIEPKQFDGVQPTHFPTFSRGGFVGLQERGVFAVTVPKEMAETDVVWTLTHAGHTYSVPGRAKSEAYEMTRAEAAFGSLMPAIRFSMDGNESTDREGIYAPRVTATVGKPVTLSAFAQDRGNRAEYDVESVYVPVGNRWVHHQGPGKVEFSPELVSGREREQDGGEGGASGANDWTVLRTEATFSEPGDYVVRLQVDNFTAPDSKLDNQCCWSNAYIPVTVTQ